MEAAGPDTLQEAVLYFASPDNCREYLVARRWPDGVTCPRCGSKNVLFQSKYNRWQCGSKHDLRQFTSKTGTIFEDSPLGLDKWLLAMWMVVNSKNGVSSYEVHRATGVTQKSAWFMTQRIRLAMQCNSDEKLKGEVEADESFIGGNVRNMHKKSSRRKSASNDGNWGKTVVLGLLQREGEVRAMVAPNRRKHHVHPNVAANVEPGTAIYTDELGSYQDLRENFAHEFVNHLETYVKGRVHTNGMENFWSLLKRTLSGTYISVDPAHLFRYLDEQCFRYNKRKMTDGERFMVVANQVINRRLTYDELIGKTPERMES